MVTSSVACLHARRNVGRGVSRHVCHLRHRDRKGCEVVGGGGIYKHKHDYCWFPSIFRGCAVISSSAVMRTTVLSMRRVKHASLAEHWTSSHYPFSSSSSSSSGCHCQSSTDRYICTSPRSRWLPCAALWLPAGLGLFAVNKPVDRIT